MTATLPGTTTLMVVGMGRVGCEVSKVSSRDGRRCGECDGVGLNGIGGWGARSWLSLFIRL